MILVFDMDGTLALNNHRMSLAGGDCPDWKRFHNECYKDEPNIPIVHIAHALHVGSNRTAIFTMRPEYARASTERWLSEYKIDYDFLYMRHDEDGLLGGIVKKAMFGRLKEAIKKESPHISQDVVLAFDDQLAIAEMWRSLGVSCCHVSSDNYQYKRGNRLRCKLRNKRKYRSR